MIHIRTCSDSANALIELLKYVLSEGDLQQPATASNEISRSSTPVERKRMDRPVRIINDDTMHNETFADDDVRVKGIERVDDEHFCCFRHRIK